MLRFELVDGKSDKFWEIDDTEDDLGFTIRYGRRGSVGQTLTKTYATSDKARAERDKLIAEKRAKGYDAVGTEGDADPQPTAAVDRRTPPPPPHDEDQAAPTTGVIASDEDRIYWDSSLARRAWAVRGHPLPAGQIPLALGEAIKAVEGHYSFRQNEAMLRRFLDLTSPNLEASTEALVVVADRAFDVDAARFGIRYALSLVAQFDLARRSSIGGLERLRSRIAQLDDADYQAAAAEAQRLAAVASPGALPALVFLFPTEAGARAVANGSSEPALLSMRDQPPAPGAITGHRCFTPPWGSEGSIAASVLHRFGLEAVPALLAAPADDADEQRERAALLARIGSDEAFAALMQGISNRLVQPALREACERQPRRALRMLSGVKGRDAELAGLRLRDVVARDRELAAQVAQTLPADRRAVIEALLDDAVATPAPDHALPTVLREPPWKSKKTATRPVVHDVEVAQPEPVLAWAPGEQQHAASIAMRDEYSQLQWLPDRITRLEQRIAELKAGRAPLNRWETLDGLRSQLVNDRSELDRLSRPIDRQAREWIASGSIKLHQLLRVPRSMLAEAAACTPVLSGYDDHLRILRLLGEHGLAASTIAAKAMAQQPAKLFTEISVLGRADLAPAAAVAFASKSGSRGGQRWMLTFPAHAAAGLISDAVGKLGKTRDLAERSLRFLDRNGHGAVIRQVAATGGVEVAAAVDAVLTLDPLALFPTKRPALPNWLVVPALPPIEVTGGAGALPEPAVVTLLTMLAFTKPDEPYAGIDQVRDACTRTSLGQFAWALFQQWIAAGAPAAGGWAYQALGLIGDDECARRLSPMIRVWPRESAAARAVAGLDILLNIGSDVSLMQLNRLAQTAPTKGLKTRAQEKIAALAEARGLTTEELADRLVPDLGLDANGTMWFDFGPRRFQVGFDELLVPFVRDEAGGRVRALPKPNTKDDPELSSGAAAQWKALKKDAADAAKVQMRRIELAMTTRRRWDADTFRVCFAEHPLMGHVARRLVWGTYDETGGLLDTFRVAEDRTLADHNDDTWELVDDAIVGLPHILELPPDLAGAWGDVLADYELLQPFAQLGREVCELREEERSRDELAAVDGVVCHFGRILSLEHRGWHKGTPLDAGIVHEMIKPLSGGRFAFLHLTQGLWMGAMNETPEQALGKVTLHTSSISWEPGPKVRFAALDAIEASELLRDLNTLRG